MKGADAPDATIAGSAPEITRQEVRQELREYAQRQERRRHVLPRALVVGLVAGLLGVLFRRTLDAGDAARTRLVTFAHGLGPWGMCYRSRSVRSEPGPRSGWFAASRRKRPAVASHM